MFTAVSSTTPDNIVQVCQLSTDESNAHQVYEVKIRAVNRLGSGPNSTLVVATAGIPAAACQMSATIATVTGTRLRVKGISKLSLIQVEATCM